MTLFTPDRLQALRARFGGANESVIHDPHFRAVAAHIIDASRSEEHTSELQSQSNLVCRLLLEKKKTISTHLDESHDQRITERNPDHRSSSTHVYYLSHGRQADVIQSLSDT